MKPHGSNIHLNHSRPVVVAHLLFEITVTVLLTVAHRWCRDLPETIMSPFSVVQ